MDIGKDTSVIIEYTVRLRDGSFVKGEEGPVSLNFVAGYNQILPALERRLFGLSEDSEAEFVIPAKEAFGEYDATSVHTRSFEEFPEGRELPAGKWVIATNDDTGAQYSYFVKSKTADSVALDFNHPLAGKDLYYRVKVIRVRSALDEELAYLRPCEHSEQEPGTA